MPAATKGKSKKSRFNPPPSDDTESSIAVGLAQDLDSDIDDETGGDQDIAVAMSSPEVLREVRLLLVCLCHKLENLTNITLDPQGYTEETS